MRHIFLNSFMFVLLFMVPVFPVFGDTVSLQECIRNALESNSDVRTAEKRLEIAYSNRLSSIGGILPNVSASAGYGYSGSESYSYGLSASQTLFDGFKSINSIGIENENLRAAKAELADARARIIFSITSGYINLYKAQEFLEMSEQIFERRKIQAESVKVKFDSGREHKGAYLTSEASLADAENQIKQARRDMETAGMRLASAAGFEITKNIAAEDVFDEMPEQGKEPDFEKIALNSPQTVRLNAAVNRARLSKQNAQGDFYPRISASGNYSKSGNDFLPQNESWRVGLNISLPVFTGFGNTVRLSNADANLMIAEINEKQGYIDKIISLREKWNRFMSSRENLTAAEKYLEAAKVRSEIARSQYSAGLLNYDNWIIIENDLVRYERSYLDSLAGLYTAAADWKYEKEAAEYE